MIGYLRLIRLPNVFTALADIGAGYLIIHATFSGGFVMSACMLAIASACLYLAGMAFNDIADQEEDREHRPDRPIPAGLVSAKGALAFAVLLLLLGSGVSAWVGPVSLYIALALSGAILFYDFIAKRLGYFAPFVLGLCRYLNVLLGLSAYAEFSGIYLDPAYWKIAQAPALVMGLYAAGVTAFSMQEEKGRKVTALIFGWVLLLLSLAVFIASMKYGLACLLIVLLFLLLGYRTYKLNRLGTPLAARGLVLTGVLGICVVDGAMVLGHWGVSGIVYAVAISGLMIPAMGLGMLLRQKEA